MTRIALVARETQIPVFVMPIGDFVSHVRVPYLALLYISLLRYTR